MRSLLTVAVALAACRGPRAPDVEGAAERELTSRLETGTDDVLRRTVRPCLFVSNHTRSTAAVFVDGRHVGWVGPWSTAGFYVGRSAGAKTHLKATTPDGFWQHTLEAPAWNLTWHLQP